MKTEIETELREALAKVRDPFASLSFTATRLSGGIQIECQGFNHHTVGEPNLAGETLDEVVEKLNNYGPATRLLAEAERLRDQADALTKRAVELNEKPQPQ